MDILWAPSLKYNYIGSVIIPLETLRNILSLGEEVYNEIRIKVLDRSILPETAYKVYNLAIEWGYKVSIYLREISLKSIVAAIEPIINIARLFTLLIVSGLVISFIVIEIKARSKEIGVLSSLGFSSVEIGGIFTIQALIAFIISGLISIPLGYLLAQISVRYVSAAPQTQIIFVIPTIAILSDMTILITAAFIMAFIISYRNSKRVIREAIYSGELETVSSSFTLINIGSLRMRYALRSIFLRKTTAMTLLLLIVLASGLSTTFSIISRESKQYYDKSLDMEMLWDIAVQFNSPVNRSIIAEIAGMPGIERVEVIFLAYVPILKLEAHNKAVSPSFRTLCILGILGNETLIQLNYIKGGLEYYGVVISEKISLILNLDLNEKIKISVLHPMGTVTRTNERITGIIDTTWNGGWTIVINQSRIKKTLGYDIRNFLMIKKSINAEEEDIASQIINFLKREKISARVLSRSKLKSLIHEQIEGIKGFLTILDFILIVGAWLGIFIVWLFISQLRRWDIALFKALGTNLSSALSIYILESSIISTLGIIVSLFMIPNLVNSIVYLLNVSTLPIWIHATCTIWDLVKASIEMMILPILAQIPAITYTYSQTPATLLSERE